MSREILIHGFGSITEDGEKDILVPGFGSVHFDQAAPVGGFFSRVYYDSILADENMTIQKNVTGQKWRVFAFDITTGAAKTGDAANITSKIAKDWAAAAATNDVNPTETEDGYYLFDLTQAETNADNLDLYPESSTANIAVIGVPGSMLTSPVGFPDDVMRGTNSALLAADTPANFDVMSISAITGLVDITQVAADKMWGTTVRALTDKAGFNVSSLDANVINAASIAAAAMNGKGDWNIGKTGYSISGAKTTLDALNDLAASDVLTQVNAALDAAISELGVAAPSATPSLRTGLMLLYMALRNKLDVQTSGTDALEIHNDAGTLITSKLLTDDGSDYTEAKMT